MLVFGLCWAPFHADRLMWSYIELSSEWHHQLFELVHVVSGVCFYLSSAINPILYNLMSTRFREMYRRSACYPQSRPANGSDVQTNRRSTFSERIANSTKSST